jgi:hypothetical protein
MLYATRLFVVAATIVGGATAVTPPAATAHSDIAPTTASPRVRIDSGDLIGVPANGVDAFKGIPHRIASHHRVREQPRAKTA